MTTSETRKAYLVSDGEFDQIIFAKYAVEARRRGANEFSIDFEAVDYCRRAPEFDKYAEAGIVPVQALIEKHGWWFDCNECGRRISANDVEDDDGNELTPVYPDADSVYCSQDCKDRQDALKAEIRLREIEVTAAALEKWPGIEILSANGHVTDRQKASVDFTFPGGKYRCTWSLGDSFVMVTAIDLVAWDAFQKQVKESSR